MKSKISKRALAALLAVLTLLTTLALPAGAAEAVKPGSLGSVTETFIDEATGRELSPAVTAKSTWAKEPPRVDGYEYQGFTQATRHIYSQEDLTYIYGYPNKTVRGERSLTRAETAAIFSRLYAGAFPAPQRQMTGSTFADVNTGDWFYPELKTCYDLGLAQGVGGMKYAPNRAVTRAEFAAFAARFAQLENSGKALFSDVTPHHWAYMLINAAAEAGWVNGYGDGTFRPDEYISRAEAVTLINRMRNRSITAEELEALGVKNPYTDLVTTYWAYGDLMEATVKHAAADWHKLHLPEEVDQVVERFVDGRGHEIAKAVTTKGAEGHAYKEIKNFRYVGYITEITYVYDSGTPSVSGVKSADKKEARVGDAIHYTLAVMNDAQATAGWKDAVITDEIPQELRYVYGSAQVDGAQAQTHYNIKTGRLTVKLGDLEPGEKRTVTFAALVTEEAYGRKIKNTAVLSGSNTADKPVSDEGVKIEDGKPALAVTKSVDMDTAKVGDTLTYTVSVKNDGKATAALENAVMADVLPLCLNFVRGSVEVDGESAAHSYDVSAKKLTVKLGTLKAGETRTVIFQAVVNENAYGHAFQNTAIVEGDNTDPGTGTDPGVTVEDGKAVPQVEKSADKEAAKVGDTLTYTIKAGNGAKATVDLENAVVADVLPQELSFVFGSVQVDSQSATCSYDSASRQLSVKLGTLAPGQSKTITFAATVTDKAYNKTVHNTAVLSADNAEEAPATDTGVAVGDGKARLLAEKSVDKETARVGDTLTYTIKARNIDAADVALRAVRLTDALPSYVDFLPGSVQIDGKSTTFCGYDGNTRTIMVEMGDIQPGKSKALTFQALVNSTAYGKTFQNTAILSAENAEDIPAADSGVTVAPGTAEGYSGAKTVDKLKASVGDELTYSIALRNSALATADWTNVKVSDTIPEFLSFVPGSVQVNGKASNEYSYDANSRTLTLHADAIKPGEDLVYTFRCTVDEGAQGLYIVNTAIVSSPGREDIQLPDTGVQIDAGETKPLLSKSASVQAAKPGDTITYSILAKNGADATADWKNITVTDLLPVGLELIPGTVRIDNATADYSLNGQVLEIFLGNLMPNESAVLTFDVKILQAAAGKIVRNMAAAKGENGEKTASDTGVAVDCGIAHLHGAKSVDKTAAKVGETLTYTVTVGNAEDASVAKNAVMIDELPEYVSLDQGSVLVDGYAPRQTYDSASRQLFAELGDIAPGQSKTITFTGKVNSNAYGQRFGNTAVLDADNAEPVRVSTPQEVEVPQGVADGSVGAKTVDKPQARVAEELTYSISLRNSALATADWTNVKVSDTIPEFLSFVPGSVQVNGKASNEYSYDANSRTLTLHADAIKPGEDLVFTFRCTVEDGAQGLYIVNTAIVSSPDREDIQLPDTGVQIDAGEPKPILSKGASVNTAKPGDIFTYNITVKNGADASADWKSVMVTDVIPAGLEFVSNSVLVDNENSIYSVSGRAIEIPVGDLRPNQEKTVSFDVRVLDTAAGRTILNTAVAKGANGPDKTATDTGVPVEELPKEPAPGAKVPTGTKTVDKVTVGVQETATFTITATNNSETTWTGVEALDTLDDSLMTLLDERVYIDGVQCSMNSGKWAFDGRTLKLSLGDILPGRSVTARFTVQFKNDAGGKVFTNFADLRSGSHDTVHVKAPEVAIQDSTDPVTDIHNGLFYGYSNGMWGPNDPIYLNQVCLVAYRNMTADELAATSGGLVQKTISDGNSSVTLDPGNALDLAVLWALKNGYLAESEYLSCQGRSATNAAGVTLHGVATQKLAYQVMEAACKPEKKNAFKDCITNASGNVSRIKFAQDICKVLGRDTKPDTGNYSLHVYTDIVGAGYEAIVAEISTTHKYTKDDSGHETWVK